MAVECCEGPSCGNLAEWRFMTPAHTLNLCTPCLREVEEACANGTVTFADLPTWAQPPVEHGEAA